jgi:hypothetical protein
MNWRRADLVTRKARWWMTEVTKPGGWLFADSLTALERKETRKETRKESQVMIATITKICPACRANHFFWTSFAIVPFEVPCVLLRSPSGIFAAPETRQRSAQPQRDFKAR